MGRFEKREDNLAKKGVHRTDGQRSDKVKGEGNEERTSKWILCQRYNT